MGSYLFSTGIIKISVVCSIFLRPWHWNVFLWILMKSKWIEFSLALYAQSSSREHSWMMNSSGNQRGSSSMFWNFNTAVSMMPLKIKPKKIHLLVVYSKLKFPDFVSCDCILYLLSEYFWDTTFNIHLNFYNIVNIHVVFLCISLWR